MIPTLHIQLLGEFRLDCGETAPVNIDVPRLQSLLAYLVLHHTTSQSRTHLAFVLWPESSDAQAHSNLRTLVARLRRVLPHADSFLRVDRHEVHWLPDAPWALDVLEFERAIAQADQVQSPQNLASTRLLLEEAVALYRGDLLPGCYDEWVLPERDRLRQLFLAALERLLGVLEQERDYQAAIRVAQRLLHYDPLHEATYRHLMRLYATSGNRAGALRTYHTCASVLERELAVEPDRATREVYERLIQMEESAQLMAVPQKLLPAVAPLVGRTPEWVQLQEAWWSAAAGHPHLLLLSGEAGIGKTRLAEELLTWVKRQGMTTASARCYAAEGDLAYAPLAAWLKTPALYAGLSTLADVWLTEVARLVPEVLVKRPNLPQPGPLVERWQRQRLFEALARAILRDRSPLLLLLDDLQWCDRESLEWVHYLLRFDLHEPLLLLGTLRLEEIVTEHPLAPLLETLGREERLTEITLGSMDAAETASLAKYFAGRALDPALATSVYQETEGNPLFIVEAMRMSVVAAKERERQAVGERSTSLASGLPSTVQAVITARLAQLSPLAREVVSVAAVIGRAFTFAVLKRASGSDEDALVQGLDELWQRRIVREQGGEAYDFSHDKLREGAYKDLSLARRRLLHRRVAEALEEVYAGNQDAVSGQIAAHYEHADLPQQAISYYQRAGEVAVQVYANVEALALFQRALVLLSAASPEEAQQEWWHQMSAQLSEHVGDILTLNGQYDEARSTYQQALAHVPARDHIWQARLHRKTAKTWETAHRYEAALHTYHVAEDTLSATPLEQTRVWWQEWIQIQLDQMWPRYMLVQMREMAELVEKARLPVEQHGTAAQRVAFFQNLYLLNLRRDRYVVSDQTREYAYAALKASQEIGSTIDIAWANYFVGYCHLWLGDLAEAEERMQAALALGERTGDMMLQSRCLTFLTMVCRKRGQVDATRHANFRALEVATSIEVVEFIGMAKANQAWIAWRVGNLQEAVTSGQAALELWQPLPIVYAFQWTALWPLIGVVLAQNHLSEAMNYARTLLAPEQQRLPDALSKLVEAALQAWDSAQPDAARSSLQQAIPLAHEMGYL